MTYNNYNPALVSGCRSSSPFRMLLSRCLSGYDPALPYSVDPDPIELICSINSYVSTLKRGDTIDVMRETLMRRGTIDAMRGTMMRKAASHDEPHNEELRRECDGFVYKQI